MNIEIFKSYEDILYPGGVVVDDIPIIRIRLNDLNAIPNGANIPFYFSELPETNQTGEQTSGGSTDGTQNSGDISEPTTPGEEDNGGGGGKTNTETASGGSGGGYN